MTYKEATYTYVEEVYGNGAFFFTDCCNNRMYSFINDPMAYHGKLCPRCLWKNQHVTLYLRGTEEANEIIEDRSVNQ